jgi:transcriptional regulator with XRE-family HTH domain
MTIGERLREARERRFLTQSELGQQAGLQIATISRIENDHHEGRPRLATIRRLAEALGVEPGWIMFGDGDAQGKPLARGNRARGGVPDTGSYPVEDHTILLEVA